MEQNKEELIKELKSDINTYSEFIKYIVEKAVGDKLSIIQIFYENEYNHFLGYVEVEKKIKDGKLILSFKFKDEDNSAEWQASDNYAIYQYEWAEDCYRGFLLFPTYDENKYFLLGYSC